MSLQMTFLPLSVKVGFNISNITLVEGRNDTVCVGTLDLEPSDIYPARNISLLISTNDTTFESGILATNYRNQSLRLCTSVALPFA